MGFNTFEFGMELALLLWYVYLYGYDSIESQPSIHNVKITECTSEKTKLDSDERLSEVGNSSVVIPTLKRVINNKYILLEGQGGLVSDLSLLLK